MPTPLESFNLRDCERCLEEVDQLLANPKFQQTLKENPDERKSIGALLTKIRQRVNEIFPKIALPSIGFTDTTVIVPAVIEEPPHPRALVPKFSPVETKGHWEIGVKDPVLARSGGAPVGGLDPKVVKERRGRYPYAMDERGFVLEGPMRGLTIAQTVRCQGCSKRKRVFQTKRWHAPDRCEDCAWTSLVTPPSHPAIPAKRNSGLYADGIFKGRQPQSLTQCRVCQRPEKCYLAKRDGWPEADLCPCHDDPPPDPETRECEGCHIALPLAETTHWPLDDICDRCAALTAPEPLTAVPAQPKAANADAEPPPKEEETFSDIQRPAPVLKPSNPFSRKREFPIGGENNRYQKRKSVEMRAR